MKQGASIHQIFDSLFYPSLFIMFLFEPSFLIFSPGVCVTLRCYMQIFFSPVQLKTSILPPNLFGQSLCYNHHIVLIMTLCADVSHASLNRRRDVLWMTHLQFSVLRLLKIHEQEGQKTGLCGHVAHTHGCGHALHEMHHRPTHVQLHIQMKL